MPRHPYPSLGIALEACGIRCHITQPIPEKGFLRLHAEGDRPGSRNVSLSRCGKGLGYLKYWKKNIEVYSVSTSQKPSAVFQLRSPLSPMLLFWFGG